MTATAQIRKYKRQKKSIAGGIEISKAAIVMLSSCLFTSACMKDESFYPGEDTETADTGSKDSSGNTDTLDPSDGGDEDTGGEDTASDSETDSNQGTDSSEHVSMDSDGDAPVVGKSHSGWENPSCMLSACHGDIDSPAETSAECAQCHGGNGAPSCARGNTSYCFDCHSSPHIEKVGKVEADCIICHV